MSNQIWRSNRWSDQVRHVGDGSAWSNTAVLPCRSAPFLWLVARGLVIAPWPARGRRAVEAWQRTAQRQVLDLVSLPVAWITPADGTVRPFALPDDPAWLDRRLHDGAVLEIAAAPEPVAGQRPSLLSFTEA